MSALPAYFNAAAEYVLSIRGAVALLGKVALGAMAYFAVRTGYIWTEARHFSLPALEQPPQTETPENAVEVPLAHYDIISAKNIFGIKRQDPPSNLPPPISPLNLRLVTTHVGKDGTALAIIEQKDKKKQDVFDLRNNSNVFDQGKLVAILNDRVKIDRNGKEETLLIEEGTKSSSGGPPGSLVTSISEDQREFTVAEAELTDELANLPRLLSQARAVPYFRNGVSIGMRLFAIRRGSLYEKLGLKNGDIVKSVNDSSLSDPTESVKIFERLKSERDINVTVERSGQDLPLHYRIQ